MPEYRAARLARSELPRSTVQTAVVLSPALGVYPNEPDTLRGIAAEEMLRSLASSVVDVRLKMVDKWEYYRVGEVVADHPKRRRAALMRIRADGLERETSDVLNDMTLDAVLTPIDGAGALKEGRAGSACVIAAVKPGAFIGSDQWTRQTAALGYLVFGVGSEALAVSGVPQAIKKWLVARGAPGAADEPERTSVRDWVRTRGLIGDMAEPLLHNRYRPTTAFTAEGAHFRRWTPDVPPSCVLRRLDGSAFVAVLAAFTNRVAATVCVARHAPTVQMAVAARALGGRLFVIPIEYGPAGAQDGATAYIKRGAQVKTEEDFVKLDNGLVVCTSTTEVCVLDRTRFEPGYTVSTETIAASIISRRVAWTSDSFDLREYPFIGPHQLPVRAIEVLNRRWGHLPPPRPMRLGDLERRPSRQASLRSPSSWC